ncbi:hypothetical protein [Glycomyces arizonensis]|uniref:hypothetical protein n=1 Tax=Glycomyces arizonensis TaxID=256035 RepID=UPI00047A6470|nr:hypothetical protein [Glycomyces arizonensis]
MGNNVTFLFLAIVVVLAGLVAFVSFLSLRGSKPRERPDILRALGEFTTAFVSAVILVLHRRGPRRPEQPPDQGTDEAPASESA